MYFYSSCEVYEGDWGENKRSGWGRMYYECGDIYEGEWVNDKKEGQGIIRYGENTWLFACLFVCLFFNSSIFTKKRCCSVVVFFVCFFVTNFFQ